MSKTEKTVSVEDFKNLETAVKVQMRLVQVLFANLISLKTIVLNDLGYSNKEFDKILDERKKDCAKSYNALAEYLLEKVEDKEDAELHKD